MNNESPSEKKPVYTCPMHPQVQQPKPGYCPKCSMMLLQQKPAASGFR
ncbi:MAG: heavy metal-binding domain-containing protein [Negativicutes bacterium]|nr:heavy metal-binding domain-containing protein [Negativicutes bacterium]